MKVKYEKSIKYKLLKEIRQTSDSVILREEFEYLAEPRQLSRALLALVEDGVLVKLGYGVYGILKKSRITGDGFLPEGFTQTAREALTKLGIKWQPSQAEEDYQAGLTTQIPVNPATRIKGRFRRTLSYKGMELRFE